MSARNSDNDQKNSNTETQTETQTGTPTIEHVQKEEIKEISMKDYKIVVPLKTVNNLHSAVKNFLGEEKLSSDNITSTLVKSMQITETYNEVHGVEKKALVTDVLSSIAKEQLENTEELGFMEMLIERTLPNVIDMFVNIDNKKVKIKLGKMCLSVLYTGFKHCKNRNRK